MKNLILTGAIMIAVIFGCNLSPAPDFKPQGWRPAGTGAYHGMYENVSIVMQGGFYDESSYLMQKDLCIGTNFEKGANTLLESVVIESGGNSYAGTWDNNTTLDGKSAYAKKQCGHIFVHWDFGKHQSEIYKQGAQMIFNLKLDGKPETVKMEIVPAGEYSPEVKP
jgi:hypothetical protein